MKTCVLLTVGMSLLSSVSFAAFTLTNGSFELTAGAGTTGIVGLEDPSGWTQENTIAAGIQNSSAISGFEGTTASQVTGSRYLRVVSDVADRGGVSQKLLGTLDAGNYTLTGDYFTGDVNAAEPTIDYEPLVEFYSDAAFANLLAAASLTSGAIGGNGDGDQDLANSTFTLSYTASGTEDIYLRIRSNSTTLGQVTRGGVDNLQLTFVPVPEPSTSLLSALGMFCLLLRRQR
ncbi:MAG: PEP-CTERM sorting domain-containing protein [Akkermansiaceae bacterium]